MPMWLLLLHIYGYRLDLVNFLKNMECLTGNQYFDLHEMTDPLNLILIHTGTKTKQTSKKGRMNRRHANIFIPFINRFVLFACSYRLQRHM